MKSLKTHTRAKRKDQEELYRMFIFPDVSLACLHTPNLSVFAQFKNLSPFYAPFICWVWNRQARHILFHVRPFSLVQARAGNW
jgi:hypothetical protein